MRVAARLALLGPGLAVAATGVGAGDLLAAMVAGADLGVVLGWAVVVGAALKLCLNEGLARWQLATGSTLLEGWSRHLGWPFLAFFGVYLAVWSFVVAAGLMSACGIAAHALVPAVPVPLWGALHSAVAVVLVLLGRYRVFERVMQVLVGVMVVTLLASVSLVGVDPSSALAGALVPRMPSGSAVNLLGLMGGVGGSVTLLSYGYWIREKGWRGGERLVDVRWDLAAGYLLTGVFGLAVLWLSATVLTSGMPEGSAGLVACGRAIREAAASRLGPAVGGLAGGVFLAGVWGAVASSLLGVWQGVPYLAADFVAGLRREHGPPGPRSPVYLAFLGWLAAPPALMLVFDRPVWVVKLYTATSGLFMPFLAASLLWLGLRRDLMGGMRLRWVSTAGLTAALVLFVLIAARQLADLV